MTNHSIDPSIFRAYDIRGKFPAELDAAAARQVGRALASKGKPLGTTKIAVGRDGRTSSPELAAALTMGINEEGLDTLELGMVPSPVAYWASHHHADGNCAMVTGSHNPKEYNGIKMVLAGRVLAAEEIQELRQLIEGQRFAMAGVTGSTEEATVLVHDYADALLAKRTLARTVKVVVDCGNGVTGDFAADWLRRLGCDVTPLFTEVDGNFPNHHPDPAVPANFAAAAAAMATVGAELVLAFDGDGDRLGVWLPGTGIAYPDRLLMLLARELLARQPGAQVIYDVKCSTNVAPFIAGLGGVPLMTRTGHSFIKREMAERNAPLGGELSGHFFFNADGWKFDDAMLAAVKLLELVAQATSASELFTTVPDSWATPEYKVVVDPATDAPAFVAGLAKPANFPGHRQISEIDGVRVEWDDGFGLLRASNTTPSLVLRFEGSDEAACRRIMDCFRTCLAQADPRLALPF